MTRATFLALLSCVALLAHAQSSGARSLAECVNEFSAAGIESTAVGCQYWFADKDFLDGRTIKMSVVRPHEATHAPHTHPEDEFFFVLEGTAELILEHEHRVVGPFTSFYCPPSSLHGIRNVGDTNLKYLVIKTYPRPGQTPR
jgi:mannose-6-phosphate isomerase-like protein (cupin superfamily)